jgi:hypothetical protein
MLELYGEGTSWLDRNHLSAVGCLTEGGLNVAGDGKIADKYWRLSNAESVLAAIMEDEHFKEWVKCFNRLHAQRITSVGRVVGVYVYDLQVGTDTNLQKWSRKYDALS